MTLSSEGIDQERAKFELDLIARLGSSVKYKFLLDESGDYYDPFIASLFSGQIEAAEEKALREKIEQPFMSYKECKNHA